MKKILASIWNFIKKAFTWMFSNLKNLFFVIAVVCALVFFFSWRSTKEKLDIAETEIIARNDSVSVYKNKNGELYAQVEGYITDVRELKALNRELYDEVKYLKDNPIVVTKIKTEVKIDTLVIRDTVEQIGADIYRSNFNYNDEWASINGQSVFDLNKWQSTTYINGINLKANMWFDVIEKNKNDLAFIARTDNPYVSINNLSGAVVSPEQSKALKRRFQKPWGIMVGIGGTATIYNGRCIVVPGLQLTLGYQIVRF